MAMENSRSIMEKSFMATSEMIRFTANAHGSRAKRAQHTRENGLMGRKKAKEHRLSRMALLLLALSRMI
jgi:hypothetical protein